MESFVGNIFYFGSPKDGFKIYPDPGLASSVFASYYTNTETDWILIGKKLNNVTTYIYVRYELLTSAVSGRAGSCFGISIDFLDFYFTDLELLRTQVIEKIWEAFLSENVLLERQEVSGKVAFKAYNLNEVSQYLDAKSQIIRKVITENYSGNTIKESHYVPNAGSNPIYELHPKSSIKAINELFETYGVVKLSPKAQIEAESVSQKAEQQLKALHSKVQILTNDLNRKNDEISILKKTERELHQKINDLNRKNDEISILKKSERELHQRIKELTQELRTKNKETIPQKPQLNTPQDNTLNPQLIPQEIFIKDGKTNNLDEKELVRVPSWKSINFLRKINVYISPTSIIIGIFLLMVGVVIYVLLASDGPVRPKTENESVGRTKTQVRPLPNVNNIDSDQIAHPENRAPVAEDVQSVNEKAGKGFFNAELFFQKNKQAVVYDNQDFQNLLTSYLFDNSKVRRLYDSDSNRLWSKITELNSAKVRDITQYMRSNKNVRIDSRNQVQKGILKDFRIY